MDNIMDVSEIITLSKSRETSDMLACNNIILNTDTLVRSRANSQHKDCTFQVPVMIVSNPNCDRYKAEYVVSHYRRIGFACKSDSLALSWDEIENTPTDARAKEDDDHCSDHCCDNSNDEKPLRALTTSETLGSRQKQLKDGERK